MSIPLPEVRLPDWAKSLPAAITVTDAEARIIYMNEKSASTFKNDGGSPLIGKSLYDCHNPNSISIIRNLIENGGTNTYTIEKNGIRKLIYQSAWLNEGITGGLVEISIVLPADMPHHIRG